MTVVVMTSALSARCRDSQGRGRVQRLYDAVYCDFITKQQQNNSIYFRWLSVKSEQVKLLPSKRKL